MRKYIKWAVLAAAAFYGFCLITYFNAPVKSEIIRSGEMEKKIATKGVIVRQEYLFESTFSGTLESTVEEGETVSKGEQVATLYKGTVDQSIQTALEAVNARIKELNETPITTQVMVSDASKVDAQITDQVHTVIENTYKRDYSKMNQIYATIIKLSEKRQLLSGEDTASLSTLESLKAEKQKLESQINLEKVDLIAPSQGIFSARIDGLEKVITPDKLASLTPEEVNKLLNVSVEDNRNVEAGSPVAKIITDFDWYLAINLENEQIGDLQVGDTLELRFKDLSEKLVNGTVTVVNSDGNGHSAVVVKCNKNISGIYESRQVDVDVVLKRSEGLKVPIQALVSNNGQTGAYVKREGIATFRQAEVLMQDDNYAIVKEDNSQKNGLLLYDEVILETNGIYDGKIIN